jgi:hypothetical protein
MSTRPSSSASSSACEGEGVGEGVTPTLGPALGDVLTAGVGGPPSDANAVTPSAAITMTAPISATILIVFFML